MPNAIAGASGSASFVSCISRTSGAARSSHQSTFSWRAFSELTFQVAMRIGTVRCSGWRGAPGSAAAEVGAKVRDAHAVGWDAGGVVVLLECQSQGGQRL